MKEARTDSMARAKRKKTAQSRPDIHAVARHAKVSIATVSRTINRVPTVDPKLAQRVWKAIEDLGFSPNTQARTLVSGKSRLLGLIVSEITNPFFPELIQGFEEVAVENGYEILIGSTNYDPRRMEVCIQRMLERKVDGVAVMTFGIETPLLDRLAARDVPLVFVDNCPKGSLFSSIEVDYFHGIREGVQHLAVLGHRKIGFISGPLHLYSSQARQKAFLRALAEVGLEANPEWLREGNHTLEGGIATMKDTLRAEDLPTAMMCSNDMTAIGVLHALYGTGYKVPQDFSVIGFDDVNIAQFMLPPLTSVLMSRRELSRCAVMALRDHLEPQASVQQRYTVTTKLTVRQSTGYPRQKARTASLPKASARSKAMQAEGTRDAY
ncbi:MAG TPA: LacI family DNA-binding transcriptional regulator [Silvibacterium sp.]|nr:LacI family DNA-binding transcriptional regulator [Silvibacterium sp.]